MTCPLPANLGKKMLTKPVSMNFQGVAHSQRQSRSGFSLIEAMMGVLVLGIVFAALPTAYVAVRKVNANSESFTRASAYVSAEMENFRTMEYSTLEALATAGTTTTRTVAHPTRDNLTYTIQTTVFNGADDFAGMLVANAVVTWTDNGRSRRFECDSVFAENGLSDKKFDAAN